MRGGRRGRKESEGEDGMTRNDRNKKKERKRRRKKEGCNVEEGGGEGECMCERYVWMDMERTP